ncbi:hypothetical protein N752_18655 [Desulforamulus aquiferis]|nr:hypothetical protein N752_18655 [Desulforamulus aquiferis]
MLFRFSHEFSKFQIYDKIPEAQWLVLALNIKKVQNRIFLIYSWQI